MNCLCYKAIYFEGTGLNIGDKESKMKTGQDGNRLRERLSVMVIRIWGREREEERKWQHTDGMKDIWRKRK